MKVSKICRIEDVLEIIDYTKKENVIKDFAELAKEKEKIGKLGEEFVYELERDRLRGTKYYEKIDVTKADDNTNGYDILSYETDGTKRYIEVKTTVKEKEEFYITYRELEKAKEYGEKYKIYRVYNIYSTKNVKFEIIDDIFSLRFNLEPLLYKVRKKT